MYYTEFTPIERLNEYRDSNGKLPEFAWPGGYPFVYVGQRIIQEWCGALSGMENICTNCANNLEGDATLKGAFIHFEGEAIECENCNTLIQSAYGPVEDREG